MRTARTRLEIALLGAALLLSGAACGSVDDTTTPATASGDTGTGGSHPIPTVPVLGGGTHDLAAVEVTEIGTTADQISAATDLAFNPEVPGELWVVNHDRHSVVVFSGVGTPDQTSKMFDGFGSEHFLTQPSGIAFGAPGTFATSQDQDEPTQTGAPGSVMGPTLWSSDLSIFNGGQKGHLDMLHNSPNSAGIAWDHDNVYWVFDGYHSSITRYDFHQDHGPGANDHSDGEVARYVEGQVKYVSGSVSHMELDHSTGLLYVCDTGNNRIVALDTATGQKGASITPNYDGGEQYEMLDAVLSVTIDGSTHSMQKPAGLALHDDLLFVTDIETSTISAFDREGTLIDWLEMGAIAPGGSLMGLAFDEQGNLYAADALGNRVLRIQARN